MPVLGDYVDIMAGAARGQWQTILARPPRPDDPGFRQVPFLPVETLLCLAASVIINHRAYGGSTSGRAPTPVPELATLFRRTPASILAKMANLDGSRPNGARHEVETAAVLLAEPSRLAAAYELVIGAARVLGVDTVRLPDFLAGGFHLLGQEELSDAVIEAAVQQDVARLMPKMPDVPVVITEKLLVAAARVGQHRFASDVLANCGRRCVFCGLKPGTDLAARGLLRASHIKPWRDSTGRERLDVANGLAACPSHDAAFDTGLLWVNGGLAVHIAPALQDASTNDPGMASTFGRPPLRDALLLPDDAVSPNRRYLGWHREQIAQLDQP